MSKLSREDIDNILEKINGTRKNNGILRDRNNNKIAIYPGRDDGELLIHYVETKKTYRLIDIINTDIDINFVAEYKTETEEQITQNNKSLIDIYNSSIINYKELDTEIVKNILISRLSVSNFLTDYFTLLKNKRINIINSSVLLKNDRDTKLINYDLSINNLKQDIKKVNIRYKHEKLKGWRSPNSGNNSGFYFKNDIETDTLIVVEGAKDAINTTIAVKNSADIFAIDSKDLLNNIKLKQLIKDKIYKEIYICLDKDFYYNKTELKTEKALQNYFLTKLDIEREDKSIINILKWGNINLNTTNLKIDITNIIHFFTKNNHKFDLLNFIKNNSETLKRLANKVSIADIETNFNKLEENNNNNIYYQNLIKSDYNYLNNMKENLESKTKLINRISRYLLSQRTFFVNKEVVEIDKYVTEKKDYILEKWKNNKINLLNAAAGSGKSYLIKEIAKECRMLIISPLESITKEFIGEDIRLLESKQFNIDLASNKFNNKSITVTTDTYVNNLREIEELITQEDYFDFIVFDEQHLKQQAHNFRHKVIECYNNIINISKNSSINTNVIFLSATPVADKNSLNTSVIEVKRRFKTNIIYNKVADKNIEKLIIDKLEVELENILIYVDSIKKFDNIVRVVKAMFKIKHNNIIEHNKNEFENPLSKANILLICINSKSKFYIDNNDNEVEFEDLKEIESLMTDKRVIYVATSKIATGVNLNNLKHIIQLGTTYNPENLIQLYNRIREDGTVTNVNTRNNQQNFIRLSSRAAGISKALFKILEDCGKNSLEYALKQTQYISYFRAISNLKIVNINTIYNKYKEELVTLQTNNVIEITSIKNTETNMYEVVEIKKINNYDSHNDIDKHNINKIVDINLSSWGEDNIIEFNNFYNTSQNFIKEKIEDKFTNSIKTKEATKEQKLDKKEIDTKKKELLEIYFTAFNTYKSQFNRIFKLIKNIDIVELERFVNKSLEDQEAKLDYGFKVCRYATDFKKYIKIKNGFTRKIIDIINSCEENVLTLKEIENLYIETGEDIKTYTIHNYKVLKELIEELISQNLETLMSSKKIIKKWKYEKNQKKVKGKRYRNFINII